MVRKSLSDTLSAEARRFLEEGKPKPSGESPRLDPKKWVPLSSGIDRLFSSAFWNDEERDELREHFLEMYRTVLEEAGLKVTSAGLLDPPKNYNPNTRALDKEIRTLRREVTVMAEVLRSVLQVVVILGGCPPEQLREYLIEQSRKRKPEDFEMPPAPMGAPSAEAANGVPTANGMHANGSVSASARVESNGAVARVAVETPASEPVESGSDPVEGAEAVAGSDEAGELAATASDTAAEATAEPESSEARAAPQDVPQEEASAPEPEAPQQQAAEHESGEQRGPVPDAEPDAPTRASEAGAGEESEESVAERPASTSEASESEDASTSVESEDESTPVELGGMSLSERLRRRPVKGGSESAAAASASASARPSPATRPLSSPRPAESRVAPQRGPSSRVDRDENGRIRRGGGRRPPLEPRVRNSPPKPKMASKSCPRCSKEVPQRSPRCLSCGFRF